MNNERSIDTFLSECCISASLSSTWREGERKKGRRRKILRKREGDRTTLERIVSPGGYGVYALKTFWYYANAIKRAESNMVRARAHRGTALSFPMVSSRGTFEKKNDAAVHDAPLSTVFHVKRSIAKRWMYKIISGEPPPLVLQIASMIIHRVNVIGESPPRARSND